MNTKKNIKRNFLKDTRAVSPALASLVLIVIAVVAAGGVGVITNVLQTSTEEQAEGEELDVMGTIDMCGSTTVLPFATKSAKEYMTNHPGVDFNIAGGGSTHGKTMAKADKTDIGMASSQANSDDIIQDGGKDASIFEVELGGRMVCVIVKNGTGAAFKIGNVSSGPTSAAAENLNYGDLQTIYAAPDGISNLGGAVTYKAFQRSDGSGTEDCFSDWIDMEISGGDQLDSEAEGAAGNPGVWAAVTGGSPGAAETYIGFVDYGYVKANDGADYVAMMNGVAATPGDFADYGDESKTLSASGKKSLAGTVYYYTPGIPSGAVEAYINYCLSTAADEGQDILADVGLIALADL